eukprot:jgi/Tetstr1/427384/TSEL_017548.t1
MEAEGGGFSGRMAAVLGALGGDSGLAAGWRVSAEEAVFKDGGDSADGAGSEDEDEELMAERGGGEGGGEGEDDALGEEDGDVEFRKSASVAFCSGLDREQEMDDFDAMATGTMTMAATRCPEARPPRDTEVLPGNYYENKCTKREGTAPQASAAEGGEEGGELAAVEAEAAAYLAAEGQRCRAADSPHRGGEPRRWTFAGSTDPEKPIGATHSGSGDRIRWAAVDAEAEAEAGTGAEAGVADAARRGGQPLVWAPAQQGAEAPEGGAPPGNPTQGKAKKARVRFADSVVQREEAGREAEATGRRGGRHGQRGGGRSAMRRGNRQRHVPDHVLHPEKYTCYTLDEPLTVGGGGGGDTMQAFAAEAETAEAAPREALPPPGQGMTFIPRKERAKAPTAAAAPSHSTGKPKAKATPRVAAAPACVAAMEADGAEGMDVDGEDAPALPPPKASAGRRQFRSR